MRRSVRLFAVVLLVLATIGVAPAGAYAATAPPPAVDPALDIPSRVVQMSKIDGTWTDLKAYQMLRGMIDMATKPGNTVATIPKPITPAVPIVRGAAGGPLVASFIGGFAIGTAGLQLYGQITGDDPLDNLCGTGFQGVGSVLYMGMMPDCSGPVAYPNADVSGIAKATYGGITYSLVNWGSTATENFYFICRASAAAGIYVEHIGRTNPNGGFPNVAAPPCYTSSAIRSITTKPLTVTGFKLRANSSGGAILAESQPVQSNPQRTPRCKIQWSDDTETEAVGSVYREADGIPISSSGLGCEQAYVSKPGAGPDLLPERISVHSSDGDGVSTQIMDAPVPEMSPEQKRALDPNISRGLVLEKTVDGVTDSCMTWAANCTNWWEDPNKTANYRCTFNGEAITLDECGIYRNTFNEQTSTPTITDPETGNQVEWSSTTSTSNSTDPGTGPTPGEACMSEWASAPNPIEWILQPIKCALVWAFVPRATVVTATQTAVSTAWDATIFGQLPPIVTTALTIPDGGNGCSGPYVDLPIHIGGLNVEYQGYPLSACAAPMSGLADWSRLISSAVIIWLTGLGIIRRASATVNAPGVGAGTS